MTLTLRKCLSQYVVERLKPERCDTTRPGFAIARLCEFFGDDRDVTTLTRSDFRDYRAKRLKDGVTDSTIRRELSVLSAALKHAAEEERISAIPVIKLPKDGRPRKRWYTEEEVESLMERPMRERTRNYLYIAIGTGARKTAITTLPVKNVDLVNGFIDFSDPNLPETKKRRPKVKISEWMLPVMKKMCAGKRPDDPVIGNDGPADVRREVKRLLRLVGIDEFGVSCHALRKTFCMWSLINGASMKEVADAVGDRVATLEKSYTDAFPEGTANAVNAIPSLERT